METVLITTNFSYGSTLAVNYGYHLSKQIKANIVLCNAVTAPIEMPSSQLVVWPIDSYESLLKASISDLNELKKDLERAHLSDDFNPLISCVNVKGTIQEVIQNIINNQIVDLVIMGTHESRGLNYFILGNHTQSIIDKAKQPILFIPPLAKIKKLNKIVFAADFKHPKEGLASFNTVLSLARLLNAEIILTHIYNEKHNSPEFHDWVKQSLINLQKSSDYAAITYKFLPKDEIESGLSLLCEQENADLLAMVYLPHNFIDSLIKGSKTQKLSKHICIPLLVLPVNY